MTSLAGRTCLITGASRGLGAAVARRFWNAGANLVVVGRFETALRELTDELPTRSAQRIHVVQDDLSDPAAPDRIAARVFATIDRLHVLVNNAAIQGPIGPTWETDGAAWEAVFRVNLFAPVALCRLCVPEMARWRTGKIINLSGGGATGPRANFSSYAAAKTALVRFSETLADETRTMGIDVNCVSPGTMNTELIASVVAAGPRLAGEQEYELAIKSREVGDSAQHRAAELCLMLASSRTDGISGKLISAVWDSWENLDAHRRELEATDVYTLRRIVPADRGLELS